MKTLLNILLYITQWILIKQGGQIEVSRKYIVLRPPKGRSFHATEKDVEIELIKMDK